MTSAAASIRELDAVDGERVFDRVANQSGPVVLRGIAKHWPLVQAAAANAAHAVPFLLDFYNQAPVTAFVSETDIDGRIFYTDDLSGTNFKQIKAGMDQVLERILAHKADSNPPTIYMGSMALDYCLPGLRAANSLPLENNDATVRIWIGNKTTVAAHYDVLENIACVCAGRRRFTLFPPDQLANLYVGPIDFTPAGQPVSLVDIRNPDLDRFPRFADAMAHAQTAELAPGDGIFIPSMWWHHVEALEDLNILINHWWREAPNYLAVPGDALLHAILGIRDLPPSQRNAWRDIFEHYVFSDPSDRLDHIPESQRGVLGELDEASARKLRALLRTKLNR